MPVEGLCPWGGKRPEDGEAFTAPVFTFLRRTPSTFFSPRTSTTSVSQITEILGFFRTRSCMILLARNWSRRWTIVTDEQRLAREEDASVAGAPPPATTPGLGLEKNPSHTAPAAPPF